MTDEKRLERAKEYYYDSLTPAFTREALEDIFPELAESEDDRIRKSIIEHLQCDVDDMAKSDCPFDFEAEIEELSKYITWLEKQGEQKTTNKVEPSKCDLGDYSFGIQGDVACLGTIEKDAEHCHPATKEQRDLLFQKIHDTGYEWNAEKKEVKKIENFPILSNSAKTGKNWSEEDEKCIDNCCLLIGAADNCYEKTFKDDCIHYLQSLKERIAWKPMWTEEDSSMQLTLMRDIEQVSFISKEGKDERIMWLNKLDDRFHQNTNDIQKSKWSEEDEGMMNHCIGAIHIAGKQVCNSYTAKDKEQMKKWLKSLKQRNGWKPSEEQIDAIRYVVQHYNPNACEKLAWDSLKTLEIMCNDLNKLKGE